MSIVVRPRGAKFELRVKNSLLPKIFTATFETEVEARNYGQQLEAILARGIVPAELAAKRDRGVSITLGRMIAEYMEAVPVSALDAQILEMLKGINELGTTRAEDVRSYKWAEEWVKSMKMVKNLAPGTIRKRVGAIARMLDWHLKREAEAGAQPLANPLRLLPKNYSAYNEHERMVLDGQEGKEAKVDVVRDRRLKDGEDAAIRAALSGVKREDRQRALKLPEGDALLNLYDLIVNTGLRLREAYRLRVSDVRLALRTIHIFPRILNGVSLHPFHPHSYDPQALDLLSHSVARTQQYCLQAGQVGQAVNKCLKAGGTRHAVVEGAKERLNVCQHRCKNGKRWQVYLSK